MKVIQFIVVLFSGLSLMLMSVLIPWKEHFMNNIFGWIFYLVMAIGLIVWVIDDIKKPLDDDFKMTLVLLFPGLFMVTVMLLISYLLPGEPFSNLKNVVNWIFN